MRYNVGEELMVVAFVREEGVRGYVTNTRLPYSYGDADDKFEIVIEKLTVTEHHKVRWDWDREDEEPEYDGYILKDKKGLVFHNQYPRASYGQTSDIGNRLFEIANCDDEFAVSSCQYRLLTDAYSGIVKGSSIVEDSLKPKLLDVIKVLDEKLKELGFKMVTETSKISDKIVYHKVVPIEEKATA